MAKVASFSTVTVSVRFYGTRGSRPVVGPDHAIFGGDTSFVVIEAGGEPVFLDLGTGMDSFARRLGAGQRVRASALLSHYHFDHVQGLPFFTAVDVEGARLRIFTPGSSGSKSARYLGWPVIDSAPMVRPWKLFSNEMISYLSG